MAVAVAVEKCILNDGYLVVLRQDMFRVVKVGDGKSRCRVVIKQQKVKKGPIR